VHAPQVISDDRIRLFVRGHFVLATTKFYQSVPCDIFVQQTAGMSKQRIARLLHLLNGCSPQALPARQAAERRVEHGRVAFFQV